MVTIKGKLRFGLEQDGVWHKDFEMRLPTLEDVERAIEDAGENASAARIRRFRWARCLTRLGPFTGDAVTPAVLAVLPAYDYGALEDAEDALLKKLEAASADTSTTSA